MDIMLKKDFNKRNIVIQSDFLLNILVNIMETIFLANPTRTWSLETDRILGGCDVIIKPPLEVFLHGWSLNDVSFHHYLFDGYSDLLLAFQYPIDEPFSNLNSCMELFEFGAPFCLRSRGSRGTIGFMPG
ncbi:hypothetical protein LguiB_021580 [Lonicera macranthoides]